jgi:hypothetical protein
MRNAPDASKFNPRRNRVEDFRLAMQDAYDFFFDVDAGLVGKGLERLDDMLRPAIMSGVLSDMLTASLAKHSRTLTTNAHFNGHPTWSWADATRPTPCSRASTASRSRRHARRAAPSIRMAHATSGCAFSSMPSTTRPSRRATDNP